MTEHDAQVLRTRHAELEQKIAAENCRPKPDEALLRTLKIQKLHIKEQLEGVAPVAS